MSNNIEEKELMTRREFTLESALAMLAGVTITVSGCSSKSNTPTSPTPTATDVAGTISANHGHEAIIRAAQITAAQTVMLDIRGGASHPHTVELTGDELRRIGQRQQVSKTSTTDNNHSHTVTFN